MIDELLEERDNLFEIASVLYGDMFITDESFGVHQPSYNYKEYMKD